MHPGLNSVRSRKAAGIDGTGDPLAGTYLAPLIGMVRSHDEEIRRQAVCTLANLADNQTRPFVAALRCAEDRSLLRELFELVKLTLDPLQRKDAVNGLTNLLRNKLVHNELVKGRLLPALLRLSRIAVQPSSIMGRFKSPVTKLTGSASKSNLSTTKVAGRQRHVQWDFTSMRLIVYGITSLCANEAMVLEMIEQGFLPELLRISLDAENMDDITVRRNAVHGLTALSFSSQAQEEIKHLGGLELAAELLEPKFDSDLRWQGAMLACNLCLHPGNRHDAVNSSLFLRMLQSVSLPPTTGEEEQLALALALLTTEPSLLDRLCSTEATRPLLSLLQLGSPMARQHSLWALSNLATRRPTEPSLLYGDMLAALINASSAGGAPSRSARRDALRTLSWLARNPDVGPGLRRSAGAGSGQLLAVVVQCALSSDSELQDVALLILGQWSEVVEYHAELVLGNALEPLILSLQYPSERAQLYGARAIACISIHKHFCTRLLNGGVAGYLLTLMRSPMPRVRRNACRAVCNLSQEANGALELLRVGGMSSVISVARAGGARRDHWSSVYAAKAVENLYDAWTFEEEMAQQQERAIGGLVRQATDGASTEAQQRMAVRSRVAFPSFVLMVTVFNGWRYIMEGARRVAWEQKRHTAATHIQSRVQARSRRGKRRGKREAAATQVQSSFRGSQVRRQKAHETKAATRIQAQMRAKQARHESVERKREQEAQARKDLLAREASFKELEVSINDALIRLSDLKVEKQLRLVDIFQCMDVDGDGFVSIREFESQLRAYGINVSQANIRHFFDALDPNDSGFLKYGDFQKLQSLESDAQRERQEEIMPLMDQPVSGSTVTVEEDQQGAAARDANGVWTDLADRSRRLHAGGAWSPSPTRQSHATSAVDMDRFALVARAMGFKDDKTMARMVATLESGERGVPASSSPHDLKDASESEGRRGGGVPMSLSRSMSVSDSLLMSKRTSSWM
jgi:hypothetical protein